MTLLVESLFSPVDSNDDLTPACLFCGSRFPRSKHSVPAKTKGHPRGRLHSNPQVNTGAEKQYACVIILILSVTCLLKAPQRLTPPSVSQ